MIGRARAAFTLAASCLSLACGRTGPAPAAEADAAPRRPVAQAPLVERPPPPRKGMVWIAGGALVAGTPADKTPRIADEEMRGEQVILHSFFIDEFPYPNEAGAIPKTGVTRDEAASICEGEGKRLCAELEWERACKGPANTAYEYGDSYRAAECATGVAGRLAPAGLLVGCKSGFGVRDTHGGPWEWTSSTWGRGTTSALVAVRGGNALAGEVVGRCANSMGRARTVRKPDIGFRCCAGEPNDIEVTLQVTRGRSLETRDLDPRLAAALAAALPEDAVKALPKDAPIRFDRAWTWRPVGNEELVVAGGCAKPREHASCGVVVARMRFEAPTAIAWASSGWWVTTLHEDRDTRDLWVFGGDELGAYHRRLAYVWGRIAVGDPERKVKPGSKER